MRWNTLADDLAERLPAIAGSIERERQLWEPDLPGQDIILGDVLAPYVLRLLGEADPRYDELVQAFDVIEELAEHEDRRLEWLAVVSVLEAFEDHPQLLAKGTTWMGPSSFAKLPTRGWVEAHAPSQ